MGKHNVYAISRPKRVFHIRFCVPWQPNQFRVLGHVLLHPAMAVALSTGTKGKYTLFAWALGIRGRRSIGQFGCKQGLSTNGLQFWVLDHDIAKISEYVVPLIEIENTLVNLINYCKLIFVCKFIEIDISFQEFSNVPITPMPWNAGCLVYYKSIQRGNANF